MTARDSIRQALLHLTVLDEDEDPTARQAQDCLTALNTMGFGLKAKEADLGWYTIGLDDDLPVDPEYIESLEYLLAQRLAPQFGVQLTAEVATAANTAMNTLQAHFGHRPATLKPAPGLRSQRGRWYSEYE